MLSPIHCSLYQGFRDESQERRYKMLANDILLLGSKAGKAGNRKPL